jgi:tRNA threonylcarbamoyladenosine biosynthesis protein TsaE
VSRVLTTSSEAETVEAGRELALTLGPGAIVLMSGDLGAGKTAFIRGLAAGLGVDPFEVSSPTFTLIHEYRGGRLQLHHVDLYRLESGEVDDLGLDELTLEGGITAIEWPDRLPRPMDGAIVVRIDHGEGSERTITIDEGGPGAGDWGLKPGKPGAGDWG